MPDDLTNLDAYAKTRMSAYGVPFENIVRAFLTQRQREQLRRMIGFRFTRGGKYQLPAKRLRAIEGHLQKRVQAMLAFPEQNNT